MENVNEPRYIKVRGAKVHNLKISMWMYPCIRLWELRAYPVPVNPLWRWAYCMRKAPDGIWSRFLLIREDA